jgi:hypothetical protein
MSKRSLLLEQGVDGIDYYLISNFSGKVKV